MLKKIGLVAVVTVYTSSALADSAIERFGLWSQIKSAVIELVTQTDNAEQDDASTLGDCAACHFGTGPNNG